MAQTIGFGDLQNSPQQNQQGQQPQQQGAGGPQNQSAQNQGGYQQDPNQYKPQAYSQQKQGTGYTNIQRVVQANQPQQLAQAVAGNVQQGTQQAQQGMQQSGQQFQQQTAANRFDTGANQQTVQNVLANPDQYVANDQNNPNSAQGSLFSRLISGQYGGPTTIGNQAGVEGQVQSAQQLGQALGSTGGQIGLLQRTVGGPQYQQGQQNLDQLLLSQAHSPEIQQARQQALALGNKLGTQEAGAQAVGQEMGNRAQAFGQGVQQQLGQTVGSQDTALQQQAKQAQQARDDSYQKMLADLKSGTISQKEADMLGITGGQQVTGDILNNISSYLAENPDKATAQNIASSQDYAKMDALRKLAGQYSPADAQAIMGQYAGQQAQAGKFAGEQGITGDTSGFQGALSSQLNQYQQQLAPAQNKVQQMQQLNDLYQQQMAANRAGNQQQAIAIDHQIRSQFPGAVGGDFAHNVNWAQSQLAQAQQAFNTQQSALQQQYGGLRNITITPEQQAAADASGGGANIQPVGSPSIRIAPQTAYPSIANSGLEQMPTVS